LKKELIIISDFDGTITIQDVNNSIFDTFGDEKNVEIENKYINNEVGEKETLKNHYLNLNLTEKEFQEFIKEKIEIDPYFKDFLHYVKENQYKFVIVSSGFLNYINLILKENNIDEDLKIYANHLEFTPGKIKTHFLHDIKSCHQPFGICGNCKYKVVKGYKNKFKKVLYIGDGLTDRCVAELADYLFVKSGSSLEEYCQNKNINYQGFNSFLDVHRLFKEVESDVLSGS